MHLSTATNGNAFALFSGFFFIDAEQGLHKRAFLWNNMGVILNDNLAGTASFL